MSRLSVVSYNVNGIGSCSGLKRRKLFNYLHTLKASVICLQETHSVKENENLWKAEWGGRILCNHGTSNARGVMILFDKKFNDSLVDDEIYKDKEGRVLAIKIKLNMANIALANIYAPNADDPEFFVREFKEVERLYCENVCMVGDMNTVLDLKLDIVGGKDSSNKKTSAYLKEYFEANDLIDIWRVSHGKEFRATFARDHPNFLRERLDYIIISASLQQHVNSVNILSTVFSDHQPVYCDMTIANHKPGKGYWKLNNSLLDDDTFVEQVILTVKEVFSVYKKSEICEAWDIMKMNVRQKALKRGIEIQRSANLKIKALEKKLLDITKEMENMSAEYKSGIFTDHAKQITLIKADLDELYTKKTEGAMLRCRANWVEFAEKPSKLFLFSGKEEL